MVMFRNTQFSDCKSETSQLTIFYAGIVNVYNNVPVDKVHTQAYIRFLLGYF